MRETCELLEVPVPDPARADTADNAYVFERRIVFRHGDGGSSEGRIDCYRRGAFVLEAKKLRSGGARSFDDALMRARAQAEGYARALPADEGRPPFLVVVDVGNVIELYAEFSRSGATYTPYPDPRSHRIAYRTAARRSRTPAPALAGAAGARSGRKTARSPARSQPIWPRWRARWRAPAGLDIRRSMPPASSPAVCFRCSPRTCN